MVKRGRTTRRHVGFLGENTNNVAELISLVRGLQVATQNYYHQVIVDEDSQIIIQLISKILYGEHPRRISPSWRLLGLLEDFGALIHLNLTLIPSHVKREANKVADHLANTGVDTKSELIHWQAHLSNDTDLSRRCRDLANRDSSAPDGVTRGDALPHGSTSSHSLNVIGRSPSLQQLRW
jgi:ribonuclease HI